MDCPIETQDVKANLKARNWAFKNVGYGPANPGEPNTEFWADKADMWATDVPEAKTMRCKNCSAFIQTPQMLECIKYGIEKGEEGPSYEEEVQAAANLGYCELFDFKCAGDRTCDAWLAGGPITAMMSSKRKGALAMHGMSYPERGED
jgi:hypothetical protein